VSHDQQSKQSAEAAVRDIRRRTRRKFSPEEKIRFSGMSGYGGQLQECIEYAIDHDLVDAILSSHNFGSNPKFYEKFLKKFDWVANQAGIRGLFKKAFAVFRPSSEAGMSKRVLNSPCVCCLSRTTDGT